jgi:LPXTG-motif cell wall-anchored protein
LNQLVNRRRRAIAGLVGMVGGAVCLVATIPGQASADPPGNNGTVKIDGVEFDSHPDNEPHVGCTFQVDWYGFDEGDLFSHVTFEVQPPTGKDVVLLTDTVPIGEDDNSGGGSEAGLDASRTYTLDLTGFEQHPQQGWHVKLTVNNDGSQGADVKHKVFWVTGCETPPTTSTSTTSTSSTSSSTSSTQPTTSSSTSSSTTSSTQPTTSSSTSSSTTSSTQPTTSSSTSSSTTSSTTSTTAAPTTSSSSETTSTTAVSPSSTSTSMAVSPISELPKTGSGSQALLTVAGIILLLGGGALLGSAKLGQKRLA